MDLVYEQLVKRKKKFTDYLRTAALVLCGVALIFVIKLLEAYVPALGFVTFLACCLIVYLIYLTIIYINVEYEYIFTNGSFDVDKVLNKQNRKHITTINAREIEIFASEKNHKADFERYMADGGIKKIYACEDKKSEDIYFVVSRVGESVMILLNPNEKIKDGFKRYNPQKVFLDD